MLTDPGARRPVLSVAMPTRNRPVLFERALRSALEALEPVADLVEVTVSDGSDDDATGEVVSRVCEGWGGRVTYVRNEPALGLVENLNRAVSLGRGEWVLVLDDDDHLRPGAGEAVVEGTRRATDDEAVLLFGVDIVDIDGNLRRRQSFRRERSLGPQDALRRVLRNSSWVRHPAAVVRRAVLEEGGPYDPEVGGSCDTEMWVRLFSRYGVRCCPETTCAYTVQNVSASSAWGPHRIEVLQEIFDRAVAQGVVPEPVVRRWQADWFHQFILAGAYRRLRVRERAEAREVLALFDLPAVKGLGPSPRWLPVRAAFLAATVGAGRRH